jgi:O-antigen ligase
MWRERPLLGFGPDNFRKLHEAFGGWHSTRPTPRHTAHSAYLEAAASTGALGLLTLVATLGAGFVGAGRALAAAERAESRASALSLLGLLAAIATHATVESLLGFTAQYLFFGFVIGAVAALGRGRGLNAPTASA